MNILTVRIHLQLPLVLVQEPFFFFFFFLQNKVLALQYDVALHVPGIYYETYTVFLRSILDDGERKVL